MLKCKTYFKGTKHFLKQTPFDCHGRFFSFMEANAWNRHLLKKPNCQGHHWYHKNVQSSGLTSNHICNWTDHSKHASNVAIAVPVQNSKPLTDCDKIRFYWSLFFGFCFISNLDCLIYNVHPESIVLAQVNSVKGLHRGNNNWLKVVAIWAS